MKALRLSVFTVLVIAQVAVVGTMALSREAVLGGGEEVRLALAPIDPRDLFRGDYVILRYEISQIDRAETSWYPEPTDGDMVWVALERGADGLDHAIAVYPQQVAGRTAIRGTVVWASPDHLLIEYGIEAYFVPEGRGWEIEVATDVVVVAAVGDDGHAVIDHLIVDGSRWRP